MMKPDQENVSSMVTETVLLLCKNGLTFQKRLKIQGLLGITVDDSDVFLIQIGDIFQNEGVHVDENKQDEDLALSSSDSGLNPASENGTVDSISDRHPEDTYSAKRRIQKQSKPGHEADRVITIKDEAEETDYEPNSSLNIQFQGSSDLSGQSMLSNSSQFVHNFNDIGIDMKPEDGYGAFSGNSFSAAEQADAEYSVSVKQEYEYDTNDFGYNQNSCAGNYLSPNNSTSLPNVMKREKTFAKPRMEKYQPAKSILSKYKQQHQQTAPFVVTKSLHECGYPNCGKQFRHKQHLLRHQTQKHGRLPTKFLNLQKVWTRPSGEEGGYESEQYDPGLGYGNDSYESATGHKRNVSNMEFTF